MDINSLTRDSKYILSNLKELPDNSIIASKECKILIPTRFAERGLAEIGVEIYIIGLYCIVMDNKYAVSNINAQVTIEPNKILKILINDVEYYEFYFDVGSTVIKTTNLLKNDMLVYHLFDEIISKANVPWYMTYDDMCKIFDTAAYHAGAKISDNQKLTELVVSVISRDAIDKTTYYRTTIKNDKYLLTNPPEYVALGNVLFNATSTLNKIAGSYFSDGVVSALVNPTDRVSKIEELLRA